MAEGEVLKLQRRFQQLNLIVRNNSISYEWYQQISRLHKVVSGRGGGGGRGWVGEGGATKTLILLTLPSLTFHYIIIQNTKLFNISVKKCSFLKFKNLRIKERKDRERC